MPGLKSMLALALALVSILFCPSYRFGIIRVELGAEVTQIEARNRTRPTAGKRERVSLSCTVCARPRRPVVMTMAPNLNNNYVGLWRPYAAP